MAARFAWFFTVPCLIRGGRPTADPASRSQAAAGERLERDAGTGLPGGGARAAVHHHPRRRRLPAAHPDHVPHFSRHLRHLHRAGTGPDPPPELGDGGADAGGRDTGPARRRRQGPLARSTRSHAGPGGRAGSRTAARPVVITAGASRCPPLAMGRYQAAQMPHCDALPAGRTPPPDRHSPRPLNTPAPPHCSSSPPMLPAAILARLLGIRIKVAVAWQHASAGDWLAYAADVSRRQEEY